VKAVGWVRVRLKGSVSGRRLNEVAARMPVRRVQTVRGGMEMDVRAADLNSLRHVLTGAGLRMRIIRRYGIVRVRAAARRRGTLILTVLCALVVIWGLMQTVFSVTVTGAKDAQQKQQMLQVMEEYGVRPGMYAAGVDREGISQEILARFPGLTYATVRRKGMAMELYVVQATKAPEVFDPNKPADVVAACGGLVTKVVALSGEALVRPGDTVVEGQVLITGNEQAAHARGAVMARVWSVGKGEADLNTREETRTGRSEKESFVRIGSWRFPEEKPSEFATWQQEEESALALDGMFFPVEMVRLVRYETDVTTLPRKMSAVKDESGARAMTKALMELPNGACVVDKRVEYSMIKDGKLRATVTLESVVQIGQERVKSGSGEN
jgi:similar to stage IV sporulation protein